MTTHEKERPARRIFLTQTGGASGAALAPSQIVVDQFNGDNFDHAGLGFFGGGYIYSNVTNGRPINARLQPAGTPRWGSAWKQANADRYAHAFDVSVHGSNDPHRENYLVGYNPTGPLAALALRLGDELLRYEHPRMLWGAFPCVA